jgi:hypothetical protein
MHSHAAPLSQARGPARAPRSARPAPPIPADPVKPAAFLTVITRNAAILTRRPAASNSNQPASADKRARRLHAEQR